MTTEERLETLERELALVKGMLSRVLNDSPTAEIRARRIILTGSNGFGAVLRMDDRGGSGLFLALTYDGGEGPLLELVGNIAGPQLHLTDSSECDGRRIQLGGDFENERFGLTVCDGDNTFFWPSSSESETI